MAETVQINEENTGSHTVTQNVANMNYGSVDSPALDSVANPIAASSTSYTKWHQFHVNGGTSFSAIQNLKIWEASGPGTNWTHQTNASATGATYNANRSNFATPPTPTASDKSSGSDSNTDPCVKQTIPTSAPGTANLGIKMALDTTNGKVLFADAGTTPNANNCSDWLGTQMKAGVVTAGGSVTVTWQYDAVA